MTTAVSGPGDPMETVLECTDLEANLRFFLDEVDCRVHLVSPADDPAEYVVEHVRSSGRIRLRRSAADIPAALRLPGERVGALVAPNGTVIELVPETDAVVLPANEPALVATAPGDDFGVGRAGMTYRDLLPDRWGGRFIASHIRIDDGGDVEDWVHFHRIRFQMIYVAAGWVDVVYEDQGPPFRMEVGDCVLQPPEIRHRVLRSSPGLEVIEVGSPAVHDTIADPALDLPTAGLAPDRDFDGQRFARHVAADARWERWLDERSGCVHRDTGIGTATDGLAGAVVVRPVPSTTVFVHGGEFALLVGLAGETAIEVDGRSVPLVARASLGVPADLPWRFVSASGDAEILVVTLPASPISTG